jgi:hypothetical protein
MAAKGNPFKSLQKEIEKWLELRKRIAESSQEIVNLNNRSSYMTNNKVHNAFGDALTPSRLSAMLSDEIAEKSANLHSLQNDQLECLRKIVILQPSVFPVDTSSASSSSAEVTVRPGDIITSSSSSCLMELAAFTLLLKQMQKQTFLEMCIVEELCGAEESDDTESDDGDCVGDNDDDDEIGSDDDANIKKMMNKSKNKNKNKKSIEKKSSSVIGDQDAAVTMLACFSYPPYLRTSEIEAFLDLK